MKRSIQRPFTLLLELAALAALAITLLLGSQLHAQQLTQTIKGTVLDGQSRSPLAGATVLLLDSGAVKGAISDEDGRFRLEQVAIGRRSIQVKMMGYETVTRSNLVLLSGKELDLEILMEEAVTQLETVEISSEDGKHDPLNQMATVSSRSFSVEEAGRYSGSFQDPARMAQNFAGVSGASDDRNDIIIRGNSPTGVLWRMEGIDIPSPNHFSTLGTTGGPVSMLNINNLSNSDFMTSAFTADYGNALSGVFDLKLRSGNADKREYLAQVGFNGFEAGIEGPFKKGSNASYLANYRYSMLAVVNALGISVGTGAAVPYYQDLTYKINLPTKKAGTFTLFGIGGLSYINFEADGLGDNNLYADAGQSSRFNSRTGVAGLTHTKFFGEKTYGKLVLAVSGSLNTGKIDSVGEGNGDPVGLLGFENRQIKYSGHYRINHKFDARNSMNAGILADYYQVLVKDSVQDAGSWSDLRNYDGGAMLLQGYAQWQHRFGTRLSMTLGAHSQHFLLNSTHSAEPRLGLRYQLSEKQNLNFGAGLHSQLQPMPQYFLSREVEGIATMPNKELDFTRSLHLVLGTDRMLAQDLRLKSEVYYQYLFNIPVHSYASSFSMLNAGRDFVLPDEVSLVNKGTGYNYGVELTVEKFFSKGYYFLTTASLFNSRYEGSDGIERNTAFNGNYVFNALGGKEFKIGKRNTFSVDTKVTYAGGNRYSAIDLAASQAAGTEVRNESLAFESQYPDYFRWDLKLTYRMNAKRFAQQFSIDFQNVTNHQNVFQQGYNNSTGKIATVYQRGFFPDVQYKVFF
jgi:hypothetical protein